MAQIGQDWNSRYNQQNYYQPPTDNSTNFEYNEYYEPNHTAYVTQEELSLYNKDKDIVNQIQYQPLPESQPFLSAEVYGDYTEIQIGLPHTAPQVGRIPNCDNKSQCKSGQQPVIYICQQCVPGLNRKICRKCAEAELANEADSLHKPTHRVSKWQPTWAWGLSSWVIAPMPTPDMEYLVNNELRDNLRAVTFKASRYYEDRAIRCFVPAPQGECRVLVYIEVEPIKSIKRERDVLDKVWGALSYNEADQVFGIIGASVYPTFLTDEPLSPRDPLDAPQNPPKKGELKLSDTLKLKRGSDFSKIKPLELHVNLEYENAIEIVLQDEYWKSDKYHSCHFKWKLQKISVTPIAQPAPSFASLAQRELYRRKLAKERQEKSKNRADQFKERMDRAKDGHERLEAQKAKKQKKLEERQQQRIRYYQTQNTHQRSSSTPPAFATSQTKQPITAAAAPTQHQFNPNFLDPERGRNRFGPATGQPAYHTRGVSADHASKFRSPPGSSGKGFRGAGGGFKPRKY